MTIDHQDGSSILLLNYMKNKKKVAELSGFRPLSLFADKLDCLFFYFSIIIIITITISATVVVFHFSNCHMTMEERVDR